MRHLSRIGHIINAWCIFFLLVVVYVGGIGISAIMKKTVYLFKQQHKHTSGWHSPAEKSRGTHPSTSAY